MDKANCCSKPKAEDYRQALQSMDSFMDVSVEDLMTLSERAQEFARQRVLMAGRIDQLMTQPVKTVHPGTSLTEAAHLLVSHHISGLPVVDESGKLTGIITEADFLRVLGIQSDMPHHHTLWHTLENLFHHMAHHGGTTSPDTQVANHMVKTVITASPEDPVQTVLALMKQHQVKRIIIVDDKQQVCGIVTRSNLVRLFFDNFFKREPNQNSV